MNQRLIIFVLAAVLAVLISLTSKAVPVEQKLIRIHAASSLAEFPNIEKESIELQAALADYADDPLLVLRAKAALLRYKDMTAELLPMYGSQPEFQEIFRQYGESVLPAIHYFVSNPVGSIEWMNKAGKQYESIKTWFSSKQGDSSSEQAMPIATADLTPIDRGWRAIQYIRADGHDFIGQFVFNQQGEVEWLMSERVMEGVAQFFGSGLRQLETRYKTDEDISAADIGWASLDVLIFASAVKVLRVGRTVSVGTKGAARGTRSAALTARAISGGRLALSGARYAKWPLLIGGAYLVISHPSIINDVLAELASVIGAPAWLIQFFGWLLILLPLLFITRTIMWFIMPFIKTGMWSTGKMLMLLGKQNAT